MTGHRNWGKALKKVLIEAVSPTAMWVGAMLLLDPGVSQAQVAKSVPPKSANVSMAASRDIVQARTVTSTFKNVSIRDALQIVSREVGVNIMLDANDTILKRQLTAKTSATFSDTPFLNAVKQLLHGTQYVGVLSEDGRVLMIVNSKSTEKEKERQSQDVGTLRGRVIDSVTEEGIAGVTVQIVNHSPAVVTDMKGTFHISNIPTGVQQVVLKLLGYKTVTRTIEIRQNLNVNMTVRLAQSANMLSGVVTTATGKQRRLEVGNSIAVLNVDSIMKVAPITNVTDLLESRVPGLTVSRTSGTPGDPAKIRVRGTKSINTNNDPIIIVDGVRMYSQVTDIRNESRGIDNPATVLNDGLRYNTPSPLDQIDPNSIETIEIFKGPSAAAMYGSDAANGVIVITTKKGQVGPARWNIAANSGLTFIPGQWPLVYYKFATPVSGGMSTPCWGFLCGDRAVDSIVPFQAMNSSRLTPLDRGSQLGTTIGVNGGTQTIRYAFTASVSSEDGVLKLPEIERERYLAFQGHAAPDWMRRPDKLNQKSVTGQMDVQFKPEIQFVWNSALTHQVQNRTSMSSSSASAISQLENRYIDTVQLGQNPLLGNPYERVTSSALNLTNAIAVRALPFSWLPISTTLGFNTVLQNNSTMIPRDLLLGELSEGAWTGQNKNATTLTGNATTTLPLQRIVALNLGMNFTKGSTNDQSGFFRGIGEGVSDPSEGTETGANALGFKRSTQEQRSFGWFLEPRYNFRNRFFVMPGFRLDNNGLSGKNAKFNGLPKMNFSWIASDEQFFPFKNLIQMFRVRTAFGIAGVQPSIADAERLYTASNVVMAGNNDIYSDMLLLTHLGNTKLRPERGVETEIGGDLEVWSGRLTFDITRYENRRKDAIIENPYATSANGGGVQKFNLGDIKTWGYEIAMTAQLLERRAIGLNGGFNITMHRSRIMKLRSDGSSLDSYHVGYPMEAIWDTPLIGFADLDGDGVITSGEFTLGKEAYLGSQEPRMEVSSYQGLVLFGGRLGVNAQWSFIRGKVQQIPTYAGSARTINVSTSLLDQAIYFGNLGVTSFGSYENSDMLRLQSLSMNVNLPGKILRILRSRNASIALQGTNLWLWTRSNRVDPNVNSNLYGTQGPRSQDNGALPEPRSVNVRIQLGY